MEFDLKFFLKILRKRMWLIFVVVMVASGLTFYLSKYYLKPTYEASAKLIVNKIQESAGVPALDFNTVNLNIKLIDVYKEIIKSPAIMDIVARQNPELGYSSEQLINLVKISGIAQTPIMNLTVQDGSHEKAVKIVNAVATVFQKQIPTIMKVDNVVILNEAKLMDQPLQVSPKLYLNTVLAMTVSLILMISLIFVLEYLNDTVQSEEDIWSHLGIPTLTAIARVKRKDLKRNRSNYSNKKVGEATHVSVL